jgi:tRNA (guanosine-2'-O-)-methyltransferase
LVAQGARGLWAEVSMVSGKGEALDEVGDPAVIEALRPLLTPSRLERIEEVIAQRTYGVTVVLEQLYDLGNMAAIMRSADSMGIQRANLVLTSPRYKLDRKISVGSDKWLDVHRYHSPVECVRALHAEGYTVLATHLDSSRPIEEIDFSQKVALVFGNERDGVTPELLREADGAVRIAMRGFAQSYNVSVAAALAMYHATQDRVRRLGALGDLTEAQRQVLRERFYRRTLRSSDLIVDRELGR